ncbi:choice-of-anchor Q domain-containing protein [Marinicella sp. W31]|uniref:choice-of-anchor Q domain-containing protein n=1 Tax=Marinicella sp. W31 TaxID=3023713 RepID=UPI003757AB55
MKQKKIVTAISGFIGMSVFGISASQAGNTITVDSISDQPEAGFTTLREAIEDSNTISGAVIKFDEAVFSEPQTITLEQGELLISSSTTIDGPGKDLLTIDGDENTRIIRIDDGTDDLIDVGINGLTLTRGNGQSPANSRTGGCVLSFELLTLNDSTVTTCESSGRGGGVFTRFGALNLNNSSIHNNDAGNEAGGLYFREAAAVIMNSTVSENTSDFNGAGIFISRNNFVEIYNSTISENRGLNTSERQGAGIFINSSSSSLTLENTTIVNNTGEGLFVRQASQVNITNNIIAGNIDGDCELTQINANSNNQNNLDTDGSCDVLATNHFTVSNPMLGPLANNGGLTMTHLPLADSPVIDSGDDALCAEFDQRGLLRPRDGDGDGTSTCDIGAVESLISEGDSIFTDGFDNPIETSA